jgi:hypothetical protein
MDQPERALLAVFLLASCAPRAHERGDGMAAAQEVKCTTLSCLQHHEAEVVRAEGVFRTPKQRAFGVNELVLEDGTRIKLPPEREQASLSAANDGKRMQVRGRIFTGMIPEKYGIIGRSPDPYLVEVDRVEVGD